MDMHDAHKTDELLVKVMLGEADAAEQAEVNAWLNESEDNRTYYRHFQLIWSESHKLVHQDHESFPDTSEAWQRFRKRTAPAAAPEPVVLEHPSKRFGWLRIAAVWLLLAGAGSWIYLATRTPQPMPVTLASKLETRTDTLPDGSIVSLNKHSSLTYSPPGETDKNRRVNLQGEAFFKVAKNPEQPLVITVNDVTVTVLGTSFNVKGSENATEVIVKTGLVQVENEKQKVRVQPDEMVTARKGERRLVKQKTKDEFYNYYFTKTVICENTPMHKLAAMLDEVYQVHILFPDQALRDTKINTVVDLNRSLAYNLNMLNQTLGITSQIKGDTILLK